MKLDKIISSAKAELDNQVSRAYQILGAKPGPGIDIEIQPTYPVSRTYKLVGLTKAGKAFVAKFWSWPVYSNHQLGEFKRQANDWEITYRTALHYERIHDE